MFQVTVIIKISAQTASGTHKKYEFTWILDIWKLVTQSFEEKAKY